MPWTSSGIITNPTAGQVLADTGPLPVNSRIIKIHVWSSVLATFNVEHRDEENAATLNSQVVAGAIAQSNDFELPSDFVMDEDERVRVLNRSTLLSGQVSVSIFYGS